MIAHVAEVGEARGRVVLRVCDVRPSEVALAAAVRVASAFQSEIETLFVRDEQLARMAAFPFSKMISPSGRQTRDWELSELERAYQAMERAVERRLLQLAAEADVPVRSRCVRGDPLRALIAACAERGPWNVIALAEPVGGYAFAYLQGVLAGVRDATGLVLAGHNAKRLSGPVVVVVDEADSAHGAARAATRIAMAATAPVVLMPAGPDDAATDMIEANLRLAFSDVPEAAQVQIAVSGALHGAPEAMAEAVRRLQPGFVIARFAGAYVSDEAALKAVVSALECPVFLVR